MLSVSTRLLKDQLSSYVHRAEQGEPVIILRDGKPVAVIVDIASMPAHSEGMALAQLAASDLIQLPERAPREARNLGPPAAGEALASTMVIEDRR